MSQPYSLFLIGLTPTSQQKSTASTSTLNLLCQSSSCLVTLAH